MWSHSSCPSVSEDRGEPREGTLLNYNRARERSHVMWWGSRTVDGTGPPACWLSFLQLLGTPPPTGRGESKRTPALGELTRKQNCKRLNGIYEALRHAARESFLHLGGKLQLGAPGGFLEVPFELSLQDRRAVRAPSRGDRGSVRPRVLRDSIPQT